MDIYKAIEVLEYTKGLDNIKKTASSVAIDIAIEALKKQTLQEPYYSGDGYWNGELVYDTWTCPNCSKSYEVDYEEYPYCPECGQKIGWNK